MTLTLLIDLDDTLLTNDIDEFLPQYLAAFSRTVAHTNTIPPELFVQTLLIGTQAMVNNRQPDCTLQEVFNQAFFSRLQVNPTEFRLIAEKFYAEVFPTLRHLTEPAPGALEFVQRAAERNYRLAIATNPLFPLTAIIQRLEWANLPPDKYPFQAVTSYETYHFAKPEAAFYAELMARLGWPEGPVVMVGNDLERDIVPARSLGLPTFWINSQSASASAIDGLPASSGDLLDFYHWLDNTPPAALLPDFNSPQAILAILRATPAVLDSLSRDLPAEVWLRRPKQDEWSLTEVLCHLRDVELELNIPRFEKLIAQDNPFIAGRDTE